MSLDDLNKDLLIKLILEINDCSQMSIEELRGKKEEIDKKINLKLIKKGFLDKKFNCFSILDINFEKINLIDNIIVEGKYIKVFIKDEIYQCKRGSCESYPYFQYKGNLLEILPESVVNDIFQMFKKGTVPYWID